MEDELERMKKCDHHVFVMMRNISKDNKPDVVIECVKCGLTNKNEELDAFLAACFGLPIKRGTTDEFHRVVKLDTMEDLEKLDLLTDEVLPFKSPFYTYHIAKKVNLSLDIRAKECYPLIVEEMKKVDKVMRDNNLDVYEPKDMIKAIDICNGMREYKRDIR